MIPKSLFALLASDLDTESNDTCGLPSETTRYTTPPMVPAPQRPIVTHAIVAKSAGTTYLATVTIPTTDDENPTSVSDSHEIIDGFQMVVPNP